METAIGVILGALATVLASRYYFQRTINKSLGIYGLLNSFVFAGIAPDVRSQLHFRFQDREVKELQQVVFLVANDGERAIRDVIEPLVFTVPANVEILDASIVHRHPESLEAHVVSGAQSAQGSDITLKFPLLNRHEFFVVKLLLSGRLSIRKTLFRILADDLPRTLSVQQLPPTAVEATDNKIEWGLAAAASVVLLFPAWGAYWLYVLHKARPDIFPYPWSSFVASIDSFLFLIPAVILLLIFSVFGLAMLAAAAFGGTFPPTRRPRFPLPKEIRGAAFPYRITELAAHSDELGTAHEGLTQKKSETRPAEK